MELISLNLEKKGSPKYNGRTMSRQRLNLKSWSDMKISKVIERLQEIQDSFGDLDAYYYDTELGVEEIVTSININSNYNAIIFS